MTENETFVMQAADQVELEQVEGGRTISDLITEALSLNCTKIAYLTTL